MSRATLVKANPANVKRLARYLHLRTDGMSNRQVAYLVYWRITRGKARH